MKQMVVGATMLACAGFAHAGPAGVYKMSNQGEQMRVEIVENRAPAAGFTVRITVNEGERCSGELQGQAALNNRDLTVVPDDAGVYSPSLYPQPCRIAIQFSERFDRATLSEGPYCTPWHGANCGFSGMVKRSYMKEKSK
jgi:hypothetical protein